MLTLRSRSGGRLGIRRPSLTTQFSSTWTRGRPLPPGETPRL